MTLDQWRLSRGLTFTDLARELMLTTGGSVDLVRKYCDGTVVPRRDRMLTIIEKTGGAVLPNDFFSMPVGPKPKRKPGPAPKRPTKRATARRHGAMDCQPSA
jgi:hypothetical protein